MEKILGGTLLFVAGAMALVSYGALSNLWADYQDSTTGTYLVVGLPWLVSAVGAAAAGIWLLRKS